MLVLRPCSALEVDPATRDARRAHPVACQWACTQAWAWEGGDALVTVVASERDRRVYVHVVVRLGTVTHVVEATGLVPALASLGVDTSNYRVAS